MRRFVPCATPLVPELWEEETIYYELAKVELSFDSSGPSVGLGKLFVTSKRVLWLGEGDSAFDFDVPYIVLHAITRDVDSFPKPCIYCQFDVEEIGDMGENDNDDEEEKILDEMFLAPENDTDLKAMFDALSKAALNNPDPPEEGEQEGDDELIYNTEEVELGAEQAKILNHLESVFNVPDDFEPECFNETDEKDH